MRRDEIATPRDRPSPLVKRRGRPLAGYCTVKIVQRFLPFFSNISYIGVFRDFFIRTGEKVFFSVFWEILPLLVSIEGGRGGVEREEGRLVGLLWRVISLLFTCFEDRENNNIWAYNKLFEVCYTGYIFFFFFGWMFLQILFSFSPPFFFRRVFFP